MQNQREKLSFKIGYGIGYVLNLPRLLFWKGVKAVCQMIDILTLGKFR